MANRATLEDWLLRAYEDDAECPPAEAYLDSELASLSSDERVRLERHAASCPACDAERALASAFDTPMSPDDARDVDRIVRRLEKRPPHASNSASRLLVWPKLSNSRAFQFAVAAVLVLTVGFAVREALPPPLPDEVTRSVARSSALELVAPLGEVLEAPVELAWQAAEGAASYRVVVLAVDETELWSAETTGRLVRVDEDLAAQLLPAVSYLWQVEALDATGDRIAWSPTSRFSIAPEEN